MQIIRTEVAPAIASTGEAILRVLFCGEGGDCVTVDMANIDAADESAVLSRARAIMVQTATFSMADNEYNAENNVNYVEVPGTAFHEDTTSIYIFEYRDGSGGREIPPAAMPSFAAAREEAVRCAIDLLVDLEPADPLTGWLVRVRNENGELLCTIDLQEAEAARQERQ